MNWIFWKIFLQKVWEFFFWNFFQDFQYTSHSAYVASSTEIQYRICLILNKKKIWNFFWNFFQKKFRIFTGFSGFFGIFGISVLPKIWVIPFNSIEYWKCSITEISILLNTEKNSITEVQQYQKKNSIFLPTLVWRLALLCFTACWQYDHSGEMQGWL